MPLDYTTLDFLRKNHPAWRLLCAQHAPLIASFLHRVFVVPNVRNLAEADLAEALEDELYALRELRGLDAFPGTAQNYLSDWADNDKGWLRKFYPQGTDEPHYDLTPATEKALTWLDSLTERTFVGTESRLLTVFDLLRQMNEGSQTDPQIRIAELQRKRDEIDQEMGRILAGDIPLLDDTALKDRFQQFLQLGRELLAHKDRLKKAFDLTRQRAQWLTKLGEYSDYRELDWQPIALTIARLQDEKKALESASDLLKTLTVQLNAVEANLNELEQQIGERRDRRSKCEQKISDAKDLQSQAQSVLAGRESELAALFAQLAILRNEALGEAVLSVESCDAREREMRNWLQSKIDAEDKKVSRLAEKIIQAMKDYTHAWPLDTREVDVNLQSGKEFAQMLGQLRADDLPRFEKQFKDLLNENTIREVANFQSQLYKEREKIKERIAKINQSLTQIDYNPGRYIRLEEQTSQDAEIRGFQSELRACTEGTLTGSEQAQYSEAKFLQVKHIIERFRGREGNSDIDRRWTEKVTDVRNWFLFAASERWREDDSEHEHYADSGGKSGGQKEKLAYTVLAASLAYQFGLEWGAVRSRSFRFVVIDEAFGRGSDESAQYGLQLFAQLNLQLLIVTPLQKIHIIEPFVANVGFVHNEEGKNSVLRNLSIEEYRTEKKGLSR